MPQFAFSATDRMGNTVEGTIAAADSGLAFTQVRQMGYTPVQVQPVADGASVTTATLPTAPSRTALKPIDLTQPVADYSLIDALRGDPVVGEDGETVQNAEWREPWQRGGPVAQPETQKPVATLNSMGSVVTRSQVAPTQQMSAAPQGTSAPGGSYREYPGGGAQGRPVMDIPYGAGVVQNKPFVQRFKEVLVYPLFSGVVIKDLAEFYRQFATLIDAGLPIHQALSALEGNTSNPKLKEIVRAGVRQVQAGGRFSDVMEAYPWIFQQVQVELFRAAEKGGMLDQMLLQIADYVEHELDIRRLIRRETFYPKLVLFFAIMIGGRPGLPMPAFSLWVLGNMGKMQYTTANYLSDTVGFLLACVLPFVAAVAVFRLSLFNVPGVRENYDRFKMMIPGLGGLVRQFAVAKFARAFGALYRAGFSMGTALEIAGNATGNGVIQAAAQRAVRRAERGELVSDALAESRVFSPMAINMIRTGETSGNLDSMLEKVGDYHENEAKLKSHQVAMMFSTGVFLLVALFVAMSIIQQYSGYGNHINDVGNEAGQ